MILVDPADSVGLAASRTADPACRQAAVVRVTVGNDASLCIAAAALEEERALAAEVVVDGLACGAGVVGGDGEPAGGGWVA